MSCKRGIISTYRSGEDVVIEWKINFSILPETDDTMDWSPDFSFGGEKWYLDICTNGSSGSNSSGHVDLSLWKYGSGRSIKQTFSLSLKTAKGEKYNEQHYMKDFEMWMDDWHTFNRFIKRSKLTKRRYELVPDGVLTLVCTMKSSTSARSARNDPGHSYVGASTQRVEASIQTVEASTQTAEEKYEASALGFSTNLHENNLHHDLKELFLKKEECDVTIKVKCSEFQAHKLILRARSPVFASTFRHDMQENATGIVEIDDCDPSSFSDFLCFLYCEDASIISQENVFGLFRAADKYQVLDLRAKCLEFVKKNITVDSFCETISLALQHSETKLIELSTDYFKKNVPKIIVTVKWQTFLAENPTESNELLVKFFVPNRS